MVRADRFKPIGFSIILLAALLAGCALGRRFYDIPPQSILPAWLSVPKGMMRTDVFVEVRYDRWLMSRTATFSMGNAHTGVVFNRITGKMRGMIPQSGPDPDIGAPYYEVVTVGSQTEVLEHHGTNAVIFVSRDPLIRKWFGLQ